MKTFLILYPNKFTEHDAYKYEIFYLEKKKNCKVIIHDLSSISSNKEYDDVWKTKREKKSIIFPSLMSWIIEFNKIKRKKNILVWDFLDYGQLNLRIFVVKLFLMFSKLPVLKHGIQEVAAWEPKKNLQFFLSKILDHKLNLKVYLFSFKEKFFSTLIKLIKFNKIFLLTNKNSNSPEYKKNIFLVKGHSFDYSNSLLEKHNNSKRLKNKYIVYLDVGIPYFPGVTPSEGRKIPKVDTKKFYKELNLFFDKLEKIFKAKIIIIPHSKYKMTKLKNKNLNPYFNNRLNDNSYNAAAKLIPKSLFVLSHGSTAISHAIINYKPIQLLYSSNYDLYNWNQDKDIFVQAKFLDNKTIDFTSIKKKDLIWNLKVNKVRYDLYKYKFLTYRNAKPVKPNHKIIEELMNRSVN